MPELERSNYLILVTQVDFLVVRGRVWYWCQELKGLIYLF